MKFLLLFPTLFFALAINISCKKDTPNDPVVTDTYLKMKVNGTLVEMSAGVAFVDHSVEQLVISFNNASSSNPKYLNIILDGYDVEPIETKSYDMTDEDGGISAMTYQTSSTLGDWFIVSAGTVGSSGNLIVIGLKDIGGGMSAAKGTFSGHFIKNNGEVLDITEGEFLDGRIQ